MRRLLGLTAALARLLVAAALLGVAPAEAATAAPQADLPVMPGGRVQSRVTLDPKQFGGFLASLPVVAQGKALMVTYYLNGRRPASDVLGFYQQQLPSGSFGLASGARPFLRLQSPTGDGTLAYRTRTPDGLLVIKTTQESSRRRVELLRVTANLDELVSLVASPLPMEVPILDRTLSRSEASSLSVSLGSGVLILRGGAGAVARLRAYGPFGAAPPVVTAAKGSADVKWPEPAGEAPSRRLEITLPSDLTVTATVTNGSVSLAGELGRVSVTTEKAPIAGTGVRGRLTLASTASPISLEGFQGQLSAAVKGAGVYLTGATVREGPSSIRVTDGTVDVSLVRMEAASLEVRAERGSVTLVLPEASSATLDVHSSEGRVETAYPLTQGADGHYRGKLGAGKSRVTLSATQGAVALRRPGGNGKAEAR